MNQEIIKQIMNPEILADIKITIVGVGSGGSSVAMLLARTGFRRLCLVDPDKLEPRNIPVHICSTAMVGQKKVDAVKQEIGFQNPHCEVEAIDEDIFSGESWKAAAADSQLLVVATDNNTSRHFLNDYCVRNGKPFVIAKVFSKGIGGEVFRYFPGACGCLACLEHYLDRQGREGTKEEENLSEEEMESIYKKNIKELKESPGLALDIGFIPLLQARMVLDTTLLLLGKRPFPLVPANYIVWANHSVHPFTESLNIEKYLLHRQEGCKICERSDHDSQGIHSSEPNQADTRGMRQAPAC